MDMTDQGENETMSEKNSQGMITDEAMDTENNEEVYEEKKRKETCTNAVTDEPEAPLQLQGQSFHVTVEERDDALVLDAEMPMLNIETLVMAADSETRVMTISGDKTSPARKRARIEINNLLVEEINSAMYLRKVSIPVGYDINQVSTTYIDGALTITFKKTPAKSPSSAPKKKKGCIVQ